MSVRDIDFITEFVFLPKLNPRKIRDIPKYLRFTPEQISLKTQLMCEHIRELGDDFSQEKLEKFERIANLIVLDEIPFPESETNSQGPTPQADTPSNCRNGFRGLGPYLPGTSSRENDSDYCRVLFNVGDDWRVAVCAQEIQFILQRRCPSQWKAKSYPGSREGVRNAIQRHCGIEACLGAKGDLDAIPF